MKAAIRMGAATLFSLSALSLYKDIAPSRADAVCEDSAASCADLFNCCDRWCNANDDCVRSCFENVINLAGACS